MSNLAKTLSRAALRWRHNSFEQYMSIYKTPLNPKIAVYGAYNQLFAQLLSKYLTPFQPLFLTLYQALHQLQNRQHSRTRWKQQRNFCIETIILQPFLFRTLSTMSHKISSVSMNNSTMDTSWLTSPETLSKPLGIQYN